MKLSELLTVENINAIVEKAKDYDLSNIRIYAPIVDIEKASLNLIVDFKGKGIIEPRDFQIDLSILFGLSFRVTTKILADEYMLADYILPGAVAINDPISLKEFLEKTDDYELKEWKSTMPETSQLVQNDESSIITTSSSSSKSQSLFFQSNRNDSMISSQPQPQASISKLTAFPNKRRKLAGDFNTQDTIHTEADVETKDNPPSFP